VGFQLLYNFIYDPGWTSGTINLFIDENKITLNNIPVEFSFNDGRFSDIRYLKDNNFHFRKSEYAIYTINFSLEPSIWENSGQAIDFEIQYFCSYNRAITEFDIQINIITEEKTIELIAGSGGSIISSGMIPIDLSGMKISVYIPSP